MSLDRISVSGRLDGSTGMLTSKMRRSTPTLLTSRPRKFPTNWEKSPGAVAAPGVKVDNVKS